MKRNKLSFAAIILFVLQSSLTAQVITPVSDSASSFYSADQDPVNLINGSGLVPDAGDILTNTANADSSARGMWHSDGSTVSNTWVAFDLGLDNFSITAVDIWQMNQPGNLGRGVKDFAIYTASTTNVADATNFVGNFSLAIGTGSNGEPVQKIPFSASGVRLIKFAIIDDWNGFTNDYVGLAEVRFEGSVPQAAIITQPQNTTNLLSESHTFAVTASGPPPLSYQWYNSPAGTAIPGATNSSYNVGVVNSNSAASYYVVVTNSNSSVTSSVVNLTVVDIFPVTPVTASASTFYDTFRAPINLINGSGQSGPNEIFNQTATANANAVGMWHTDGSAVNGTWAAFDLGAQFTLSTADIWQMNQSGNLGRGVKDFAIYASPTTNIADATNFLGNYLLAESTGAPEPVQRFSFSNSVSNVRLVEFVITDDWNGLDPDYVGLSEVRFEGFLPAVAITSQPANTTNLLGESHSFTVTASGTPPLSYQWHNSPAGTAIPGATNSSYGVGFVNAGSATSYYVVVNDANGSITSSVVSLTVVSAYPVTPVSDSASSFYSAEQDPVNLINGNGQSGPNEVFNQTANPDNNAAGMWHTDGTAVNGAWVAFDLGTQYTLSSADVWQMNQLGNFGRGVKDFAIFTASTTNLADATNLVGNFSLAESTGAPEPVQRLSFSNSVSNVRLVEFVITDDWNGLDPDYTGLSEVRFEAQPLSPHFSTFGATGGMLSLSAQGGIAHGSWVLLQSTSIASPLGQWQAIANGAFDASGNFSTNLLNPTNSPQSFFILKAQ